MPSGNTIASGDFNSVTSFTGGTTISSSDMNTNFQNVLGNFDIWRGNLLPFDASTTAAVDQSYDLGSSTYRWLNCYASIVEPVASTNGAFTATITGSVYTLDATSSAFTVTLPTAVGIAGKTFTFKKLNTNTNAITIDGSGSETIDLSVTSALTEIRHSKKIISDGSNWHLIENSWSGQHRIIATTVNGHGSTNNKIRLMSSVQETQGNAITRNSTAANGDSYVINIPGYYSIRYADRTNGSAINFGLSLDSSSLTTSIVSITTADRLSYGQGATGLFTEVGLTRYFDANATIRPHTHGTPDNTTDRVKFHIEKVG